MRTNQQLKELNLPRCDWNSFLKYTGEAEIPEKDIKALDDYFIHFVQPGPCIKCGMQQEGIVGRFTFGIQNGEGTCCTGGCGWPARAIHRNVGPISSLEWILQYHPDVVSWDKG